uniref:Glutamyl-tRNA(Gln) amidotransferase subunit B, mitochondrial n=1 Tax=Panagrellus redivivus TaxID=6233 RepID=A0A7E4V1Z9_PANRE
MFGRVFCRRQCVHGRISVRCGSRTAGKTRPVSSLGVVEPVIGLEVHAQLLTKTKLFSAAAIDASTACNSSVADFDLGVPGTLPRLNKECVQKSLQAALLLNSQIQPICRFDRKHYFYPDMPMGYQITQQDYPIAKGGWFEYYPVEEDSADADFKKVRLHQVQLEIDSGKTIKMDGNRLFIDLNRAGVGLIEIVTHPDFNSASEAAAFVDQLRLLLIHNHICAGELHKGNMRIDANVSIRVNGQDKPRTEIKNINSIRLLKEAINNEVKRQISILEAGDEITNVTLNADDDGNIVVLREKSDALDYRFTPEPNLPRLKIESEWVAEAKANVRYDVEYRDYIENYGVPPGLALSIVKDDEKSSFVRQTLPYVNAESSEYFNWFKELRVICGGLGIPYPPLNANFVEPFVLIVNAHTNHVITKLVAIDLLKGYLKGDVSGNVDLLIEQSNLIRLHPSDPEFQGFLDAIIAKNEKVVHKIHTATGNATKKAFNKLRNELINTSEKRISVEDAEQAITSRLGN